VALDRALGDNPGYTMAQLLRQAIDSGAPPSLARIPMTPEEVAASYDEVEDGYDGGDCGEESAGALKNEARDTRCRAPSWVIETWRQDSPRQRRRGDATRGTPTRRSGRLEAGAVRLPQLIMRVRVRRSPAPGRTIFF
jgi:hypothetical protein